MKFVPPGEEDRRRAIGSLDGMPRALRTLLQPAHFEPIPRPGPNDWLANHAEPGETFDDFRRSRPNRPDASRRTIYLQPLDDFPASGPTVPTLKEFTEAFFAMRVRVLPVLPHRKDEIRSRINRAAPTPDTRRLSPALATPAARCILPASYYAAGPLPRSFVEFRFRGSFTKGPGPRFYGEDTSDRAALVLRRTDRDPRTIARHRRACQHIRVKG